MGSKQIKSKMALYVNNKNVLFAINKELRLLSAQLSTQKSDVLYKITLPSSKNTENSSSTEQNLQNHVVSASVADDGRFLAASDSCNFLHLWKLEKKSFEHVSVRKVIRKSQKIIFTHSGAEIVVADRGGDVHSFSVADSAEPGKFLLGHISLVIDVAMTSDDSYILTSDRDGKVRVSHYPNCYNIHSYCLGHEEFVSSVQCIEFDKILLLSSSGDGSLMMWDLDGNILCCEKLYDRKKLTDIVEKHDLLFQHSSNLSEENSLPFVLAENQINYAIRNVRYSPAHKLYAVHFYNIKGVAIYEFVSQNGECSSKFVQVISLPSVPFDLFFDFEGNLLVLGQGCESEVKCFQMNCNEKMFVSNNSPCTLSKHITDLCTGLSDLTMNHSDHEILFKRHYESEDRHSNMQECTKKIKCN